MSIDSLTIGEAKKISAMFGGYNAGQAGGGSGSGVEMPKNVLAPNGQKVIAVLQRGHVAVGIYWQDDQIGYLKNAAIIRRWGTTDGLGELAMKGPLPETKLDKCPDISFHIREVIMLMNTTANTHKGGPHAWREYFDNY